MSVQQAGQFKNFLAERVPADEDRVLAQIAMHYGVQGNVIRFLYIIWKLATACKAD